MGNIRFKYWSRLFAVGLTVWVCVFAASSGTEVYAAMPTTTAFGSSTGQYAPLDRPGPTLDVPQSVLSASLSCTNSVVKATRNPILLVAGTTLTPNANYSWNYERAFDKLDWPYCTVKLPDNEMADIQTAGEYIVYALRQMHQLSGRHVDILGFSQGGMVPRWALRFWPDTRSLVDDFVAIDPSNHGTLDAKIPCMLSCAPAIWQQQAGSHFLQALNSGAETFSGISYTVIYSRTDEVVFPNLNAEGSSSLHTGGGSIANIAVQQICPTDISEHLAMGTYDPVAYDLAVDAFTHSGPADPARISPSVCTKLLQPGVDPLTFPTNYANLVATSGTVLATYPHTSSEPQLASYVYANPTVSSRQTGSNPVTSTPGSVTGGRGLSITSGVIGTPPNTLGGLTGLLGF